MPPIFATVDLAGAFSLEGPLTYLHMTEAEVRAALEAAPRPPVARWYHATTEQAARAAVVQGLVPSCWCEGDSCCVFGYSSLEELPPRRRRDWLIEIESRALPGQLKAWWVPPQAIRGAHHQGHFYTAGELRDRPTPLIEVAETCGCELAEINREQIARWRRLCQSIALR